MLDSVLDISLPVWKFCHKIDYWKLLYKTDKIDYDLHSAVHSLLQNSQLRR